MKAQVEIVGLVFVVIIGIFGLLVYAAVSGSIDTSDDLRERQLALSMLTTMVQVDVGNLKYNELVASCVARNENCEPLDSSSHAMLKMLEDLNQPYEFRIHNEEGFDEMAPIKYDCEGVERTAANTQPIPLYGSSQQILLSLSLCK